MCDTIPCEWKYTGFVYLGSTEIKIKTFLFDISIDKVGLIDSPAYINKSFQVLDFLDQSHRPCKKNCCWY